VDWRAIRACEDIRRKGKPELTPGPVSHCRSHAGDSQAGQAATSAVWSANRRRGELIAMLDVACAGNCQEPLFPVQ